MKKARLEIRINEDDKQYLKTIAELEQCTVTDLLDEHIQELITKLRRKFKHIKPPETGYVGTLNDTLSEEVQ